jgi:hypothetical protein
MRRVAREDKESDARAEARRLSGLERFKAFKFKVKKTRAGWVVYQVKK